MELPVAQNRGRLTFWLYYAARSVSNAYADVLRAHCEERGKPYIVTPPQWGALSLLLAQDGMIIGGMAQMRGVDAPAATGIISRLEQIGLVERRHDCEDRRVVKVYLTDEGRDISQSLVSPVETFEQSMKRGFAEGDLDRFLAHLQRLITDAAGIGGGAGDRLGLLGGVAMESAEGTGQGTKE